MHELSHFGSLVLGTVIGLLPIINPLAATAVFVTITNGDTPEHQNRQALRGCGYMVMILVSFLIGGTFIMNFFGISIPGLRIAGGLVVCGVGFGMLASSRPDAEQHKRHAEAQAKGDISFSPLAMPMLSGPGSIAVTIGFTSLATGPLDYLAIIAGILIVAVITYVMLRLSERAAGLIGANGTAALNKVMGFLILCIGVQFIVNGTVAVLSDPELVYSIRKLVTSPAGQ